jgi:hypothetical protein
LFFAGVLPVSIVDSQPSAELSRSFLEPDIVQRVLKVSDFVVLFFGTAALFAQSAYALDTYTATMMTFSSMVMVFATLLGLRGLGAYEIHALLNPIRSMVTGNRLVGLRRAGNVRADAGVRL